MVAYWSKPILRILKNIFNLTLLLWIRSNQDLDLVLLHHQPGLPNLALHRHQLGPLDLALHHQLGPLDLVLHHHQQEPLYPAHRRQLEHLRHLAHLVLSVKNQR